MKTVFGILAAMTVSASLVSSLASVQAREDGARIEIEPEEFDFGNVQQDQKLVYDFTLRNTGTEDLVVRRISTSCGCTAALTSDRVVSPGGSTTLTVTLETRKYKGVIERSVSVASNDRRQVHTVRLKAYVESSE